MSDFFEDLVVGTRLDLGHHTFTADEIVGFARRYDPQPFHLDDAAAAETPFGRLAASGWHTVAVWMKLYVTSRQATMAALKARGETPSRPGPSPGFRSLKWRKPVHVGDTISYASTLTAKHSSSKAGWAWCSTTIPGPTRTATRSASSTVRVLGSAGRRCRREEGRDLSGPDPQSLVMAQCRMPSST